MIFRYRHSSRSIFTGTRSVLKRHNIWHKHYRTIWWDNFSFDRLYIHHDISIQKLTTLDLRRNEIGAEGARHLAQALQNNTVRQVLFRSTDIHHDISIQTLTTLDLQENNIGDEGVQNLAQALQNNAVRQLFFRSTVYSPWYFNTDTHHAQSSGKQDRWWRGTISSTSITEQHGETSSLSVDCIFTMIFQYRHSPR